ncbi:ABC transporter permease [Cryptosporangium arvum]|uniref:Permease component of ribose/xylose/arabinose/galactoside ABC-type transporter n=1 Tax=Cryptosporangium arvum DSM 44712 TaxID=927661 RepID=A0A010YRB7_9ACTN|nr:ABC transporter permease [Cryptosporangium arvum]EXG82735.1 permease component of ribose/xylose/arabinose/galactoside ABC-type transporter [Cryptosporangium arvum DSM 44712]
MSTIVAGRRLSPPQWTDVLAGAALLALLAVGASTERFLTVANVKAILTSASLIGIAGLGLTLIVIGGTSVSLAISQSVAVSAMVFLAVQSAGLVVALVATIVVGALITGLQGLVVGYGAANPIVLTIAAGFALTGLATGIGGGTSVSPTGTGYTVLNATPGGIPLSVYALVLLTVALQAVLDRSAFGRQLYLTGENRPAARAAGLPVGRVVMVAWVLAGALFAVAAAFSGAFNTSANINLGGTLTFDAIAAVLAGGTPIAGGKGSAWRTLAGVLLIATVSDILLLRGYGTGAQIMVKGLIVLAVIVVVHLRTTRGRR